MSLHFSVQFRKTVPIALAILVFAVGCGEDTLYGRGEDEGGETPPPTGGEDTTPLPPEEMVPTPPNTRECPLSPANQAFAAALCVCSDLVGIGNLDVRPAAADPVFVGINGRQSIASRVRIVGDLWTHQGFTAASDTHVTGNLLTTGKLESIGVLVVDGDLSIGGDLRGGGRLEVGRALRLGGDQRFLGDADYASRGAYQQPAGTPCGCGANAGVDVRARIAAARTANDNVYFGIATDALASLGDETIELKSGRYYFENVRSFGTTRFHIDGHVSMFVDGAVDAIGDEHLEISPGSTLDLFVSDTIRNLGVTRFGNASSPTAFRMYVGGSDVSISLGASRFAGALYAPRANVVLAGNTLIDGALFAGGLTGVGNLDIDYSRPPKDDPSTCR